MHSAPQNASEASLKEGYEVSDMKPGLILIFFVALLGLMYAGIALGLIFLRWEESSRQPINTNSISPLADPSVQMPGQKPYLQGDPVGDRRALVAEQEQVLDSYGWVSEEHGAERARLPIAVAMERVASGDVPYRQAPQTAILEDTANTASEEQAN